MLSRIVLCLTQCRLGQRSARPSAVYDSTHLWHMALSWTSLSLSHLSWKLLSRYKTKQKHMQNWSCEKEARWNYKITELFPSRFRFNYSKHHRTYQSRVSFQSPITELIRAGIRFNYPSPNLSEQEFFSITHHRTYQSRVSFQLHISELFPAGFHFQEVVNWGKLARGFSSDSYYLSGVRCIL